MRRQHLITPRVGLTPHARALFAVLRTAAAHGRMTHTDARAACGLPVHEYTLALGLLADVGCLPVLVITPVLVRFTVCDGSRCACLAGGAQ